MESMLECPLCMEIFSNVTEAPCCHACYCRACLEKWLLKNKTCPSCRKALTLQHCKPNIPLQRLVDNQPVKCPNEGCNSRLTRSILNEHLEKCEFEIIGCPIGNSERCQNIKRGELGKHISYECPERKVSCKLCSELMSFSMLDTHLKKSCPQQDVECKYCFAKYKRKEESAHLIQCPEVPVECPFADFGCKTKVPRKQLSTHENDKAAHYSMIFEAYKNLEKRFQQQQDEIETLKRQLERTTKDMQNTIPYSKIKHYMPSLAQTVRKVVHNQKRDVVVFEEGDIVVITENRGPWVGCKKWDGATVWLQECDIRRLGDNDRVRMHI